jgi:hypothetical protein
LAHQLQLPFSKRDLKSNESQKNETFFLHCVSAAANGAGREQVHASHHGADYVRLTVEKPWILSETRFVVN